MAKSWSETIMKDQRWVFDEAPEVISGPESVLSLPSSVAIGADAEVGDVTIQPFTPEVKSTILGLAESFGDVISRTAGTFGQSLATVGESTGRASELLGEKLQETQLGTASILPGMAKYLLVAAVVIIIAGKVWK